MKFDLPRGPSLNTMFRNVPGIGRVRTGDYKAWAKVAGLELMAQKVRQARLEPPLTLTIRLPDSKGKADMSNFVKACEDLLVGANIIPDDNDKIIRKLVVEVGAAKGRCEIELEELR